ncbi:GerMN domain-containing protein [Clostridium sp. D2Q-11]|uniref:GerMN domain-containing protein n=1 Tax=Anaeromonas frigoriresistens TaxID=2683708 RepID=A0A942USZ6_9FIRM|nr:GerMN domain-containing protein [Anaeromonas frigoriresistens]MBS4538018.1 GerMN domain-containing protein [Anaeromonas frigoriresistens]
MKLKKIISLLVLITLIITMTGCGKLQAMKEMVTGSEDEIVEMTDESTETVEVTLEEEGRETVLYYKSRENLLVPIKRNIPWETGIAKKTLGYLTKSEENESDMGSIGLEPIIPVGSQVLGMSIDESTGLCKVNFSEEILNSEDKVDEVSFINGVVYTLTEFPTISEVQFIVDGEILETLTYGTDVSTPIKRRDINLVDNNVGDSKVVVYYKGTTNGEYEYYVPVTETVATPSPNMYTALEELFNGPPESSGLYTDIPMGVALQGVEVKDGVAFIDLSEDTKEKIVDQSAFDSMVKNIALTLDQFSEIERVEILINGKTLEEAKMNVLPAEAIPTFANEY